MFICAALSFIVTCFISVAIFVRQIPHSKNDVLKIKPIKRFSPQSRALRARTRRLQGGHVTSRSVVATPRCAYVRAHVQRVVLSRCRK